VKCRLCESETCNFVGTDGVRTFAQCSSCNLVFVPDEELVSVEDEKCRYAEHDNSAADAKYVEYITSFADEIGRVPIESPRVLDFGCGPAQVLEKVLAERHVPCESYDPLYGIGAKTIQSTYDVVAMCEVMEHLRDLQKELDLVKRLLNRPGYVVVRTELYTEHTDFESWWYARDITHINFFRLTTMLRIAEYLGKGMFFTNARNVMIFG